MRLCIWIIGDLEKMQAQGIQASEWNRWESV